MRSLCTRGDRGRVDRLVEKVEGLKSREAEVMDKLGDVRNVTVNNSRRGCSYKEFLACNPKEYDGKGGAIVYTRWIEKIESVQDMSGCGDDQKVKYNAGLFISKALTWWNSQIHTRGRETVVGMPWEDFKTLMR
ncbi:hypothetical protein Tco_0464353 [Tanacetum coccineum]